MTSHYGAVRCTAVNSSSSFLSFDSRLQPRFKTRLNLSGNLTSRHARNCAIQEQSSTQFDWFRFWWPVQLTSNFHLDRPNPFELLDQNFVAWNGSNGDWIVMEDQCPHRMAPLSQGRVEPDGTLLCSHHSWRFNKDGRRVRTPQTESCEEFCRSSVRVFPCRIHSNILWVWPEASDDAFRNSDQTPIPVPTECDEYLTRKSASGVRVGFTRVMPYSLEILIENLIDPAHVPVTHHGLIPGMIRTEAKPLWMKSCPLMFPQSIVSVKYKGRRGDSERFSELLSPCSIINGTIEEGIDSWKGQLMLGSPIRSGKCRLFFFNFPGGIEETGRGFVFKIFGFVQRYLPWLMHLGNHSFVDGDAVFLHRLEVNLRSRESPWNALNYYYVPTSADLMIQGFRNWMKKSAGHGPGLEKGLRNGQLPEASRRELLDRYYTHTIECKDCQNGRKMIQRIIWSCGFLAGICLVYLGIALSKVSALRFDLKIAGCVVVLSLCLFVRSFLQRNVIPQFEFVDYVHPEKN